MSPAFAQANPPPRVKDTTFSHDRGFYDAPFEVVIASATTNAVLYYTRNGGEPSPSNGLRYTAPVAVTNTTVLRARAYADGMDPTDIDTQTYLFLPNVIRQPANPPGFPSAWISQAGRTVTADYTMDPGYPESEHTISNALRSLPSLCLVMDPDRLFGPFGIYNNGQRPDGGLWETNGSLELIHPDGSTEFQVDCGVQPRSHDAFDARKRGFKFDFKAIYGPAKLEHPVFEHATETASPATRKFNSIHARAGYMENYTGRIYNPSQNLYFRDLLVRDAQIAMSGLGTHNRFVHVYLNGLYWGLMNLTEGVDEDFAADYFGGEPEEWLVVKSFADSADNGEIVAGDPARYQALLNFIAANSLNSPANYATALTYLDPVRFADYMILQNYFAVGDWPDNNWIWIMRNGTHAGPGWFLAWDAEKALLENDDAQSYKNARYSPYLYNSSTPGAGYQAVPSRLWRAMIQSAEFRMLFADRVHKHLFNAGPLTDERTLARFDALGDLLSLPLRADQMRWSDDDRRNNQPGVRFTYANWLNRFTSVRANIQTNVGHFLAAFRSAGLYPAINPPLFSQLGGTAADGFPLLMANPNGSGVIYYTLNGQDPRQPGGTLNEEATQYVNPIPLMPAVLVKARVLAGGAWSVLTEAAFVPDVLPPVRVTELMFNPSPPTTAELYAGFANKEDFEFLTVKNFGATALNLDGYRLSDGVTFTFASLVLAPGTSAVVVRNAAAFAARYGVPATLAGAYTGNLSNSGERLRFWAPFDQLLLDFTYDDGWEDLADGNGFSLVVTDVTAPPAAWNTPAQWRPSHRFYGAPGQDDPGYAAGTIVLNEVQSRSAVTNGDFIELRNTGFAAVDVSGWFLSDRADNRMKYRIAEGTVLPPGGLALFTQAANFGVGAPDPGALLPFGLDADGETVYLTSNDNGQPGGYRESETYGASDMDTAFGLHIKSTGKTDFIALTSPTPGALNAPPRMGPLVINELMYHPLTGGDEWIELFNLSPTNVALYDPAAPTNAWRFTAGITFSFPPGTQMLPGSYALVTGSDPVVFRGKYSIPASVPVFGSWAGALDNAGEAIELSRPAWVGTNVSFILVDRVKYQNAAPWPPPANGLGPTLAKLDPAAYGNDVVHWAAGRLGGTPGALNEAPDFTPPNPPAGLGAQPVSPSQLLLTWNAATDPESGIAHYVIYQDGVQLGTTTATAFYVNGLTASTPYTFSIAAVNGDRVASAPNDATIVTTILAIRQVQAISTSRVALEFSEPVTPAAAQPAHYSIPGLSVTDATLSPDGAIVTLATSAINPNAVYVLTIGPAVIATSGASLPPQARVAFSGRTLSALLVHAGSSPNAGDTAVKARLEGLGFTVQTVQDSASLTSHAAGKSVVVISSTVNSGSVSTKFRDVGVAVVVWESFLYDDLRMTGTTSGTDYGTVSGQTSVQLVNPAHPMAAGLSGTVAVTAAELMLWGVPGANAITIATVAGDASKAVIFGYENGANMVGLTASARRVGLHLSDTSPLTADGWNLFDAALRWAANAGTSAATNLPPLVGAGTNQTVSLFDPVTLRGWVSDDGLPASPGTVTSRWTVVSAPGPVTFGNAHLPVSPVQFSAPGVHQLRLEAGDGQHVVAGDVTLTVQADAWQAWQRLWFLPAELNDPSWSAREADADGDGLANYAEFGFGTHPRVPETAAPWQVGLNDSHLTLFFPQARTATEVCFALEVAPSLGGPWNADPEAVEITEVPVAPESPTQRWRARVVTPVGATPQAFLRLRVSDCP